MRTTKISSGCLIIVVILGFISCRTTRNVSSIEVEILNPAIFAMPENIDTIAIFKRDYYQSDTFPYQYINGDTHIEKPDTSVHYSDLSNQCVDALAHLLEEEGYFLKVINYRDSMNYLVSPDSLPDYHYLHHRLGADALVFLDYFELRSTGADRTEGYSFFLANMKAEFPEFQLSTIIEIIDASLVWTLTFRGDTSIYLSKQPERLYYGSSVYPELFGNDAKHKLLLKNTTDYLGRSFATRLIPSWQAVQRTYYQSNNDYMLIGEKYFLENDWLKAAEIYNKQTTNKNRNIAAKAKYNMAVICEMEGNLEAAIDWIERSNSTYKIDNYAHKFNCKQYASILDKRKEDTQILDKQVRNYAAHYEE